MNFEESGLGRTPIMRHTIELTEGATPIKDRHYPVSPAVQTLIYQEVDEMLRLGVIEESDSAWSNTITLVRKPGKNRLCLDARKLNKITIKDAYPQQNIEGILTEEEGERPIAFFSQKLNPAQRNYSVTEKECLAAVLAVERFRPYIELMPCKLLTDHSSLQWIMSVKNLAGRLARWSFKLQPYQMSIEHCKGTENVVADTLSRMLEAVEEPEEDWMLGFQTTEFESPEYVELRQVLESEKERFPDVKVVDGYVFKRT
ncbi:hypothetical protein KR074_003894, partial [Drosophila pseudoananassae]